MRASSRLHRRRSAFTIIEGAIVLGVVGLVIAAVWVGGAKIRSGIAVNMMGEQVDQIVDNVRALYLNRPTIFVDNTQAIDATGVPCGVATYNSRLSCLGAYPADLTPNGPGGDAFHDWNRVFAGGSVQIIPRDINFNIASPAVPGNAFGVQLQGIPDDICIQLVMRKSLPDERGLKAILFLDNTNAITAAYVTARRPPDWTLAGARANFLPLSAGQAVAACNGSTGVEWIFALR